MIIKFYDVDNNCYSADLGSKGFCENTISQDGNLINIVNDYRFNDAELDVIKNLYLKVKDVKLTKLEIVYNDEEVDHKVRSFDISNTRLQYRFSNNDGFDEVTRTVKMYDRENLEIAFLK